MIDAVTGSEIGKTGWVGSLATYSTCNYIIQKDQSFSGSTVTSSFSVPGEYGINACALTCAFFGFSKSSIGSTF